MALLDTTPSEAEHAADQSTYQCHYGVEMVSRFHFEIPEVRLKERETKSNGMCFSDIIEDDKMCQILKCD